MQQQQQQQQQEFSLRLNISVRQRKYPRLMIKMIEWKQNYINISDNLCSPVENQLQLEELQQQEQQLQGKGQ